MYIIIVGGGYEGEGLIQLAMDGGHEVVVIESDESRAEYLTGQYDVKVLHANIATGGILDEAGVQNAHGLVAATNDDSANLMAMFLGKEQGIDKLISIVNDKSHAGLFERLGVMVLVDPERIIAQHLYERLCQPRTAEVIPLPDGAHVFSVELGDGSPLVDRTISEATENKILAERLVIAAVKRDDSVIIPVGDTRLKSGDRLTVFSRDVLDDKQMALFMGDKAS